MTILNAGGKSPVFLGRATQTSGVTVGPIIWAPAIYEKFVFPYYIEGYNGGTPVGRFLCGSGSISTTALTNITKQVEDLVTVTTTANIPGIPLAKTLSSISRQGWIELSGQSGKFKRYSVHGQNGNQSVTVAPTGYEAWGDFSDLGSNLLIDRCQLTVYDTLVAVLASTNQFIATTTLEAWGFPP